MLFSGYICATSVLKFAGVLNTFQIKKLLIRALTKSPGVSTSGLSFLVTTATLADAADKHFYLLGTIPPGKFYRRNDHIFQAGGVAATVTNKMNMIIPVMPF